VKLFSPVILGIIGGHFQKDIFIQQLRVGIPLGIASGLILVGLERVFIPYLPEAFLEKASEISLSPLTRFLYGGITEEVMVRWGIMSLLVFTLWKAFNRRNEVVKPIFYWIAIIGAALFFGMGHLPIAMSLAGEAVNNVLITYIIVANSIFGIVAGWLFWKYGLEAAIVSHIFAHVVMIILA
ncbi:MAG: CPBP family glutamic-type intramembrane protease, partial [Bacteroidota bacterium]